MTDSTEELYREHILEHARAPRNWSPPGSELDRIDLQYRGPADWEVGS